VGYSNTVCSSADSSTQAFASLLDIMSLLPGLTCHKETNSRTTMDFGAGGQTSCWYNFPLEVGSLEESLYQLECTPKILCLEGGISYKRCIHITNGRPVCWRCSVRGRAELLALFSQGKSRPTGRERTLRNVAYVLEALLGNKYGHLSLQPAFCRLEGNRMAYLKKWMEAGGNSGRCSKYWSTWWHSCRKLEALLGYEFRNLGLLKEACTHCSWPDQTAPCYQRLEFLGDAALDFLISRYYILGYRQAAACPPPLHRPPHPP